jgi:amino acid transporter
LYISYAGVTKVAAVAGEIKNPEKNLPKTMLISLF